MKILSRLNRANLRQNRARTTMTIVGIALSITLIFALVGTVTSLIGTERADAVEKYGDYHINYRGVPGDQLHVLENTPYLDVQFFGTYSPCVQRDDYEDCYVFTPYLVSEYEVINPSDLVRDGEHLYNVFLNYADARSYDRASEYVGYAFRNAGYDIPETLENSSVVGADGFYPEYTRIILFSVAGFILGIMAIVAAFVIRNSFNISVSERTRQFGMLASLGARPRQIRGIIYREALLIGAIALPLGLAFGALATLGIAFAINQLVGDNLGMHINFYAPPSAIAIILCVGILIIFLSAASPAILAGRTSPISAIRGIGDVKVKAKRLKSSRLTRKIWGIGGVLASKNLKRSRKKYRTTVISIVLSIAVFIAISAYVDYGNKLVSIAFEDSGANLLLTTSNAAALNDVVERFRIQEYAIYRSYYSADKDGEGDDKTSLIIATKDEFSRYAKRVGVSGDASTVIMNDYKSGEDQKGNLVFKRTNDYNVGDTLSFGFLYYPDNFTNCYSVHDDYTTDTGENEQESPALTNCLDAAGREYREFDFEIDAVTDLTPLGFLNSGAIDDQLVVISEEHPFAARFFAEHDTLSLYIADSGLGNDIKDYIESDAFSQKHSLDAYSLYLSDFEGIMQEFRNIMLLFRIIAYGFIAVAALVGATNIFNTISTNIALRAKEFAVLKSVGMTNREFNRMIRLESLFYTTRSLFIGIPLGLLASLGAHYMYSTDASSELIELDFIIPWQAIIISIVAVALLVALIMRYSTRKIKHQNIIETIRKESF